MVTLPCISLAISSSAGPIILHGPHHSAQKSTTTGPPAPFTSDSKLASVTLTVDMSHLSRTRARDDTARNCSQGKNAEGLRQATRPPGSVAVGISAKDGKRSLGECRLNDASAPMADKGARLNTKQNPFSLASKSNHRAL